MLKVSIFTAAAAVLLQTNSAFAASQTLGTLVSHSSAAPHPSLVAVLALVGMGFLVLMARAPVGKRVDTTVSAPALLHFNWKAMLTIWPNQRAAYALLAIIAVSGSLGLA